MSLKILLFPISIVLSLTLIIGYIKPDVSAILLKRAELAEKQIEKEKTDTVIQNVQRLHAEVDQRRESENFVLRYLPRTLEEERVLDIFNYLASQSGVVIVGLSVKENEPREEVVPEAVYTSASVQAIADAANAGDPTVPVMPPTKVKESYNASVTAIGTYQNLKDFFMRLARTDRMHETLVFSMAERKEDDSQKEEDAPQYPADFLKGDFEADFMHFKVAKVHSVARQPLFQSANFDFAVVDDLLNLVNNPLPLLEVGATGKPNPFQP